MLLLSLLLAASPSLATALRGFDNTLSPQALAAFSADPAADLIAVADDVTQPRFVRARAIALLSRYAEPRTQSALLRLSADPAAELRVKAVKGLKYLRSSDPLVRAALDASLQDSDRFVRMQAVRAIAASGERATLERHRAIETDVGVRRTLDEVLSP